MDFVGNLLSLFCVCKVINVKKFKKFYDLSCNFKKI